MNPRWAQSDFDAPAAAIRAAGGWLARRDRGLTSREAAEFETWLRASPEHRAAFAQLERASASFDRLKDLVPVTAGEPDPDFFAPPRRAVRWVLPSLAAAGFAAAAALAVLFWTPAKPAAGPERHFATEANGYQRAVLSDGSVVELNADTSLAIEFTDAERRARLLRGEAHFQVAKNAGKPFVVIAEALTLRVVGTAFDVRLQPSGIEVFVTEGAVEVEHHRPPGPVGATASDASRGSPRLTAGQKLVLPAADSPRPTVAAITPAEIDRMLAWQSRITEFSRTPLGEAVAQFNRHSAGRYPRIVVGDGELDSLRIGGNFRLDQPESFVRLLESSFGIVAERSSEQVVLKAAR